MEKPGRSIGRMDAMQEKNQQQMSLHSFWRLTDFVPRELDLWPFFVKINGFQGRTSMSSLVIIAGSFFETLRGKTNRQTDLLMHKHRWLPYPHD